MWRVVGMEPGGEMLSHPCELGTRGEGRSRPWQPPFLTQALCQSGHAPHPPTTLQAVKVNSLGKWKTALQMVAMTALLVLRHADLILGPGYESGERGPGVWPGVTEPYCAGKPLPGDEHLSKLVAGALCTGHR